MGFHFAVGKTLFIKEEGHEGVKAVQQKLRHLHRTHQLGRLELLEDFTQPGIVESVDASE